MIKLSRDSVAMMRPYSMLPLLLMLLVSSCAPSETSYDGWGGANNYGVPPIERSTDNAVLTEEVITETVVTSDDGYFTEFTEAVGDVVYFDTDRSDLSSDARAVLLRQADWLARYSDAILLEGHADERGTREYNLALGARRAQAVRDFMIGSGIDPARISVISYGKERPVETCSEEVCWKYNRRVLTVLQ